MNMVDRVAAALALVLVGAGVAIASPPVSRAAQCGPGTFYDAPSDTCLVAAAPAPPPLPPPPPPPPPNVPAPVVSASICAPIPLVALCVGI